MVGLLLAVVSFGGGLTASADTGEVSRSDNERVDDIQRDRDDKC